VRAGRSPAEGFSSLCATVQERFAFVPTVSFVGRSVAHLIEQGQGVCQDFVHYVLHGLRAAGVPARYVSGYLAEADRQVTAEASHAWVEVVWPGGGTLALDPTNGIEAGEAHIRIGAGADYDTVAPMRGIYFGEGEQSLDVRVELRAADTFELAQLHQRQAASPAQQ